MNHPEESIERVLTGLREATVPAGMEARLLSALEAHAIGKSPRDSWRARLAARGLTWPLATGVATAGVCVAAVLVVSMHRAGHVSPDGRGIREKATVAALSGSGKRVPHLPRPQESRGVYDIAEAVPSNNASRSLVGPGNTDTPQSDVAGERCLREAGATDGATDFEALAISEMLAPSKPAPPLPLTHQEKLLAQVVRKGDPKLMEDLKPEVREKQVEIAKTEFHDFFEPPFKENE